MDSFIAELRASLPAIGVSSDREDLVNHSRDRWPEAAKWSPAEETAHAPGIVVRPHSTSDVAGVLALANRHGIAVVPFGGGSGVVGGVIGGGVFVSLDISTLNGEPTFDDDRGEVVVPAGVLGGDLERMLNERGRRLPHYPQSLALASVGGLVATRSSGTFSSKYGNIEDLLVSLELVLADGTVVSTKTSARSATGPNIAQLFVGSEGTLGVITAVTLRTFPLPATRVFHGVGFDSLDAGIATIRAIMDAGVTPAVIRLYDPAEAEHLFVKSDLEPGQVLLILGFDGLTSIVEAESAAALALALSGGGTDLGTAPGDAWEQSRFDASWLERGNAGDFSYADAIEVSASWPDLVKLHGLVLAAMAPYVDKAYAHYSHFYPNGGAIYFILFTSGPDAAAARERYRAAWDVTLGTVLENGGSISHHHGVGEARKDWMAAEHGESLRILAAVKRALDPNGILAPGKLGIAELEVAR